MKLKKEKKRLFDSVDTVYAYFERGFDFFALSMLWLLFSLPIVTIGASTTALYYALNKVMKRGRGYLAREFARAFARNLIPATLLWIVTGIGIFLLQLNIGIIAAKMHGNSGLFLMMLYVMLVAVLTASAIYAFAALSRFDMASGWIFKLSLYMTVRYWPTTLYILAVLSLSAWAVYWMPLALLLLPSCTMWVISGPMEKALIRHTPQEKGTAEDEASKSRLSIQEGAVEAEQA